MNTDFSPTPGGRFNSDSSIYEPDALLHACETQPFPSPCLFYVEAFTFITNCKMNLLRLLRQFNVDTFDPAMLGSVVERFLQDSKQGDTNFEWYSRAYFSFEVDLNLSTLAEFFAPACHACNHTQIL